MDRVASHSSTIMGKVESAKDRVESPQNALKRILSRRLKCDSNEQCLHNI